MRKHLRAVYNLTRGDSDVKDWIFIIETERLEYNGKVKIQDEEFIISELNATINHYNFGTWFTTCKLYGEIVSFNVIPNLEVLYYDGVIERIKGHKRI
jgi:hypothetical protein